MSLHGNFERAENGFKFPKGEFGEGKFHLKSMDGEILVQDGEEMIASTDLSSDVESCRVLEYRLIDQLEGDEEKFLEVIGGSDYLKDFLERIVNEEPISN